MLKAIIVGIFAVIVASSAAAQTAPVPPLGATDITAAEVQAFLKALPRDRTTDSPIRVVDLGGYRLGIYGVYRPKTSTPPNVTAHQTNIAEIYYVLEGSGTLITGGTFKEPVNAPPQNGPWANKQSAGVEGGLSRKISKGDWIIIPGFVPHSVDTTESDITYLNIRPDPDSKIPLK